MQDPTAGSHRLHQFPSGGVSPLTITGTALLMQYTVPHPRVKIEMSVGGRGAKQRVGPRSVAER